MKIRRETLLRRSLKSALKNPFTGKRRQFAVDDYARLKAEVSIEEYIAFDLDETSIAQFGEARFLCPFHDDTNPSLWANDHSRRGPKWGCHPCGLYGDIFDFVQKRYGATRNEARDYVEALAISPDWKSIHRIMRKRVKGRALPSGEAPVWPVKEVLTKAERDALTTFEMWHGYADGASRLEPSPAQWELLWQVFDRRYRQALKVGAIVEPFPRWGRLQFLLAKKQCQADCRARRER